MNTLVTVAADGTLPQLASIFKPPFDITPFHTFDELQALVPYSEILICRSTLKVNQHLLKGAKRLRVVATASSGSEHLDKPFLLQQGIKWIDAKGSNAKAVADYVLCSLASLQKRQGFNPQTIGIVGCGAVGTQVYSQLIALGLPVYSYDPPRALTDRSFKSCDFPTLLACDLICIHPNLHDEYPYPTRFLFDAQALKMLKPGTAIINASRGQVVCEEALLALNPPIYYCTDVFANEPHINPAILDKATLCTPHIAGHSIEAKIRGVNMIYEKLLRIYPTVKPQDGNKVYSPENSAGYGHQTILKNKKPHSSQNRCLTDYLRHYDPFVETNRLKADPSGFIHQRAAHDRHELL